MQVLNGLPFFFSFFFYFASGRVGGLACRAVSGRGVVLAGYVAMRFCFAVGATVVVSRKANCRSQTKDPNAFAVQGQGHGPGRVAVPAADRPSAHRKVGLAHPFLYRIDSPLEGHFFSCTRDRVSMWQVTLLAVVLASVARAQQTVV